MLKRAQENGFIDIQLSIVTDMVTQMDHAQAPLLAVILFTHKE